MEPADKQAGCFITECSSSRCWCLDNDTGRHLHGIDCQGSQCCRHARWASLHSCGQFHIWNACVYICLRGIASSTADVLSANMGKPNISKTFRWWRMSTANLFHFMPHTYLSFAHEIFIPGHCLGMPICSSFMRALIWQWNCHISHGLRHCLQLHFGS